MGFPPAGAQIYRNEAGEVTGWDNPAYDEPDYDPYDDSYCEEDDGYEDEDDYDDDEEPDYDPGPEIDDQGGMSEFIPAHPGRPPF